MHTKRVTLFRLFPFPWFRRVTVARITVRGFREALRVGLNRVLEWSAALPGKPTPEAALESLGDPATVAALADLIVVGQRPGFFRAWHSQKNAVRLMRASTDAEGGPQGWGRILALIDWTGEKVKRGGGLVADIGALCALYKLSPLQVLDMTMQDFLDLCDFVTASARAQEDAAILDDPTLDPEARPTPIGEVDPRRGKVWVH